MMEVFTEKNFEKEVLKAKGLVVVDFGAPWCHPCRSLGPVFEKLAQANPDIKFGKVDIDDNGQLAVKYEVSSIPVVAVFRNGKIVERIAGIQRQAKYQEAIDKVAA